MEGKDARIETLEKEINQLHATLESQGINSHGTTDIFGRKFAVPVNSEHKATVFVPSMLLSAAQPHMRTFWAATFGFFCTFFSVFAPAGLMPYIARPREEGGIGLSLDEKSLSGNLAVTGTIVMRVLAGPMCDKWGARKTFILLLLLALPGMGIIMASTGAASFILGRVIVGLSLATFVTCQVWCSQFFERKIVGTVNATAGGWGNLGGGITILVIPQIMEWLISAFEGSRGLYSAIDISWRLCFIIPLCLHIIAAIFIYTGRDLADGSYAELELSGAKQKSAKQGNSLDIVKVGFSNTNALIMLLTYGLCFGVELTMNNKLVGLFHRYYAIKPRTASVYGSTFSLMNAFARSWGGILSDQMAARFGLRGRVTSMWIIQTCCGIMCIMLGVITLSKDGPDEDKFSGVPKCGAPGSMLNFGPNPTAPCHPVWVDGSGLDDVEWKINTTIVNRCGSKFIPTPWMASYENLVTGEAGWARFPIKGRVMVKDPHPDCIHNGSTLSITMICVIIFSLFVQMAEGLHFGVVPYISRPALGVVSGMVGAGGNFGALVGGQWVIRAGFPLDEGFVWLGTIIITVSMLMHCIFFPGEGGILLPKNFPYDPQWIKPKEGAQGSDELKFDNVKSKAVDDVTSTA